MSAFDNLKAEITIDPLTRGYAAMNAAQVVIDLRTAYRSRIPDLVSASGFSAGLNLAEYLALTDAQRSYLALIFADGGAATFNGSAAKAGLLAIFGAGTATRTALLALLSLPISRAAEIGFPDVTEGDVARARA